MKYKKIKINDSMVKIDEYWNDLINLFTSQYVVKLWGFIDNFSIGKKFSSEKIKDILIDEDKVLKKFKYYSIYKFTTEVNNFIINNYYTWWLSVNDNPEDPLLIVDDNIYLSTVTHEGEIEMSIGEDKLDIFEKELKNLGIEFDIVE